MTLFTFICNIVGLVSNICILFLTVYTLYLTAFSKKMDFVSMGHSLSAFFGDTIHFHIRNCSLHSIPVTKVFLLKRIGGMFHMITIAKYEEPLIIDAWHIAKIETEPFTRIVGIDEPDDGTEQDSEDDNCGEDECDKPSLSTIHMDAVIGVETGKKVIWIKPYKKAPLRAAKRAYNKYDFDILSVSSTYYNDKVLSKCVDFAINLLETDLNGQKVIKTVFAMVGDDHVLLSDTICGHNGLDGECGSSAEELETCLCEQFGIARENMRVDQIDHIF
ncbi:MAG: hypothetical protein UHW97_04230 [Frisingicoccus sp.]|nr:hypothetical protein [Frisingicoccus sp.]